MAIVGRATVVVRALTDQFRRDLRAAFDQAERDADASGERAGGRFGASFRAGMEGNGNLVDFSRVGAESERAGRESSRSFNKGADNESRGKGVPGLPNDVGSKAAAAGGGAGSRFSKAFSGAFGSGGPSLPAGFISGFAVKLLALLPIIATLLAALSALASGLFAVASAGALAAAGGLALLPGILGAVVAAIGVGIIAFGGIGKAVKELGESQAKGAKQALAQAKAERAAARAVKSAADGIEDAQERVVDAQERVADSLRNLDRARRDAARGAEDAAERVTDAEEDLVDAQERAKDAQMQLSEAREDAAETLEDLQLSLRGAVLGESEAVLRLNKARQEYQEVLNDSDSTGMDREQARIDLQQAELALDQARDRRDDVTKQTVEANEAGIEGSDQVVDAKKNIEDANEAVADSEEAVADAREAQARQAVDSAERIADAQESVSDAYKGVEDALEGVAEAQERYTDALENQRQVAADGAAAVAELRAEFNKMGPAAQSLALYLSSLRDEMKEIKNAVQEAVLPAFEKFIRAMTTQSFLGTWKAGLVQIGGALGGVFDKLTELFSTDAAHKDFHAFFRIAAGLTRDLGGAFATVIRALLSLTAGGESFFGRFGKAVAGVADRFLAFIETARGNGTLELFFTNAFEAARSVGDALGAIFGIFKTLIVVAAPFGVLLLDMFTRATNAKNGFFNTAEGQANLMDFFRDILPNAKAVFELIGALGAAFIRIGDNPAVKKIVDDLTKNFVPALENVIDKVTTNFAPAVFGIITDITKFLAIMADSKVLKATLDFLKDVTAKLVVLAGLPFAKEIIAGILVLGAGLAIFGKFNKLLGGFPYRIIAAGLRGIGLAIKFLFSGSPLGFIILAITLIGAGLFLMYKKFDGFRKVVDTVIGAVVKAFKFLYMILLGRSIIPDIVNGTIAFFTMLKDVVSSIVGAMVAVVTAIFNGLKAAIEFIVGAIVAVIKFYVTAWLTVFRVGLSILTTVVGAIFGGIKAVITFVFDAVVAYFKFVFEVWSTIFRVGLAVITTVVGFVFNAIWTAIKFIFNGIVIFFRAVFIVFSTIFRVGFDVIKTIVSTVFNAIKNTISVIFTAIRVVFRNAIDLITGIWRGLWSTISSVASTVFGGVRDTIDRILGGIKTGFTKAVDFVKTAWDKIRGAVSTPIKTVVDFAYNKGIRPFWNNIAGLVGLSKLDPIDTAKFAKGGHVPGYAPGRDTVRALLSPGEGVLVPEAVRGIAAQMGMAPGAAINSINSRYSTRVSGPGGPQRFASGGVVKPIGGPIDIVKSGWDGVKNVASDAFGFVVGQLAKGASRVVDSIVDGLDAVLPDNKMGELLQAVPRKIGDGIISFLTGKDKEENSKPSGSSSGVSSGAPLGTGLLSGSGWPALVKYYKESGAPGIVTSTKRNNYLGNKSSYHNTGRAADFSVGGHGNRGYGHSGLRAIFDAFLPVGKQLTEMILAGAPYNIKRGQKVPGYGWRQPGQPGNHWNHVHVALAKGGTVLPRPGGTHAILGEAGRAESVVDTGLINKRLRDDQEGHLGTIAELRRITALLSRMESLGGGLTIENLNATAAPNEQAATSVPRALRSLAFQLGA